MAAKTVELPAFVKGHTAWYPKAKAKGGTLLVKCGDHGKVTAPDAKGIIEAVRTYAKAHNWVEVA